MFTRRQIGLFLIGTACIYLFVFVFVRLDAAEAAPLFHPDKTYRSVSTDLYEVTMQKNGFVDVSSVLGPQFFNNAIPRVELAGETKTKDLQVDPRFQERTEVNDPLGEGQGVTFVRNNFKWSIRTYPSKPFLTVQLSVTNDGKKAMRIAKLVPWCVGELRSGSVYFGPAPPTAVYWTMVIFFVLSATTRA